MGKITYEPGDVLGDGRDDSKLVETVEESEPDPDFVPIERRILLKLSCTGAGSCCGGSGKAKTRYAILDIATKDGGGWTLIAATKTASNLLDLAKRNKPIWIGAAFGMGLHEDVDFMAELKACDGLMKAGCVIVE